MLEVQNDRQSLEFISSRFDTVSQSVNAAEQYKIRFYLKVSLYPTLLRSFHQGIRISSVTLQIYLRYALDEHCLDNTYNVFWN